MTDPKTLLPQGWAPCSECPTPKYCERHQIDECKRAPVDEAPAEPIAWRLEWPDGARAFFHNRPRVPKGCTLLPLYEHPVRCSAAPPPSSQGTGENEVAKILADEAYIYHDDNDTYPKIDFGNAAKRIAALPKAEAGTREALERCIQICLQEAEEWDSDKLQTLKNYAGRCANRISDEVLSAPQGRDAGREDFILELPDDLYVSHSGEGEILDPYKVLKFINGKLRSPAEAELSVGEDELAAYLAPRWVHEADARREVREILAKYDVRRKV